MAPLARLRRVWLDVHLWLGVGLLVVFIPLSVTGSILVWHDPLDRALHADRYAVSGATVSHPVQTYAQSAQAGFGARARLTQVRLPERAGDPVVAVGRIPGAPGPGGRPRTLNAWIDPPTARVLSTGEVARTLTMVLHRVHGSLLIPEIGRKVVGWLGWAMFVSSATGLWLWWPRHAGFLKGLRWRRGASGLFNLHHLIGFWVCVPLAVLSLTGVYISFPQTSRAVFGLPQQPPRASGPGRFAPPIQPRMSVAQAVAAASPGAPGAVVELNVPTKGEAPAWRLRLKGGQAGSPKTVQVIDATGEVKTAERGPAGGGGVPDAVSPLIRKIHDGAGMGLVWQVIIFVGGLAPAVLGLTGVIMWLRRRSRRQGITRTRSIN